jgi:catechol 2,3-dioxygenase-like lactoylglutathione lyase family enzyme
MMNRSANPASQTLRNDHARLQRGVADLATRCPIERARAIVSLSPTSQTVPKMLAGVHHVCLPVSDVERAADWFAEVLGFVACVTSEDENHVTSILLEHTSGAAVLLRADPARAVALSGFPALAFAVTSASELRAWGDHLTSVGVVHTEAAPAHLGWTIRLWGPDKIELRLTTPAPLDGAADD